MAEKDFAYVDRVSIVHIVDVKETALRYAGGPVVEIDPLEIPNDSGYPLVGDSGHVIVDIEFGTIYVGGNGSHGKGTLTKLASLPEKLQALLVQLGYKELK